jgi:hypothetical protein
MPNERPAARAASFGDERGPMRREGAEAADHRNAIAIAPIPTTWLAPYRQCHRGLSDRRDSLGDSGDEMRSFGIYAPPQACAGHHKSTRGGSLHRRIA